MPRAPCAGVARPTWRRCSPWRRSVPGSWPWPARAWPSGAGSRPSTTPSPAPVHAQAGVIGVGPRVENPVFPDRGNVQIEFDIADEVLVRVVLGNNFDNQDRTHVLPAHLSDGHVQGEILVGGQVRSELS